MPALTGSCSFCPQDLSDQTATPKKEREDIVRRHKESVMMAQQEAQQKLLHDHKGYLDLEMRKFKREKTAAVPRAGAGFVTRGEWSAGKAPSSAALDSGHIVVLKFEG